MIPIDDIISEDGSAPYSFEALAKEVEEFLLNQEWCNRIRSGYLDIGWEGILAVFIFEFEPAKPDVDESVWVVVGDLPTAYLCNDHPNGPSGPWRVTSMKCRDGLMR